ncbi:hypothetical protein [Streptomyces sp. UNOC14_S4]|uniref:hypothetical protein n=1 Tax=Streptomyces sp. UNOC14_S4 TaxID=2872340 RepID=UPI001E462975|nr:hypothetical protein [Streptomyces sp. UNOC14_S4]MCC3767279.1 hypothetical protein [Streptomyces sp. UNOC14_S4]
MYVITPRWTVQAPYVRTTLRRALGAQSAQDVWSGTEHINNATAMIYGNDLPDSGQWTFTKSQLATLVIALKWRRVNRDSFGTDTASDTLAHYEEIEDAVNQAYRSACHAEGRYWM